MEAEHFTASAAGTGAARVSSWRAVAVSDSSGGALQALPHMGVNATDSKIGPRLDYKVKFATTGTYYIWVRLQGANSSDNGINVGLNGTVRTFGGKGLSAGTTYNSWVWSNTIENAGIASLSIASAGYATINVWMREDGVIIDKIILTTNSSYQPTGAGPTENAWVDSAPPSAPTGLKAADISTTAFTLTWTAATDNVGVTGYQIYKNAKLAGSATTTSFSLTGLTAATTYTMTVKAKDAAGHISVASSPLSVTTNHVPIQAPTITTQPASLTVNTGQKAVFKVVASGTPAPTYQWNKNGVALAGATLATLTLPKVLPSDAGSYTVTVTNVAGSVTSNAATLTVNVAPTITTQPASQTVNAGQTAAFIVVASGTPTPTYQWRRNGTAIAGATSATLTLPNAQLSDAGNYTVVVSNSLGTVPSSAATLTVNVVPTITTQPASVTVNAGANFTFKVVASGTPAPTYQWNKNGAAITGANSATLTLLKVLPSDAGSYTVTVTNLVGSVTSNAATLTENVAPTITTQPANQTVNAGQTAAFTVVASGTPTPTYQWKKNGTAIAGATSATLSLPNVQLGDAGKYTVAVTNSLDTVTSSVAALTVNVAPMISTQPADQTVNAGANVTFKVVASGTPTPTYQWKKNGAAIPDATATTLTLKNVLPSDAGSYSVTVTNVAGLVTSNAATLTVNVTPTITAQPGSETVNAGQTAAFTVVASGTPTLTYQWKKNGTAIADATAATLTLPNVQLSNAGKYTVVVTNSFGTVTSSVAALTVNVAPMITTQPASQTVNAGANVTFKVVVSGTPTPIYQWKKDGAAISGATAATLALQNVLPSDAGSYTVTATNAAGSVTSNVATLAMNVAPTITTQPASLAVNAGQSATFAVVATGTPAPTYQWKKGVTNISGATSATYTLTNVQASNAGNYTVVVKNSAGSVTSNAATLTVNVPPTITSQPASQTVNAGANVTFTVVATGTPTYQWKKDGTAISGATAASLTLTNVQSTSDGSYTVVVANAAGSVTSNGATLTVNTAPAITTPPASLTVNAGQSATFTVVATGTPAPTYQWKVGGTSIAGATSAVYTLTNVQIGNAGSYTVVVTNTAGSVTSSAATLTVDVPPAITTQPASQTVNAGSTVTFTVAATGTPAPTYQWKKDGTALAGATAASLLLTNVQTSNAGNYTVVVANVAGTATSIGATLAVNIPNVPVTFTTQPTSQTVNAGSNVTFTAAATGTPIPTYQWLKNDAPIPGATNATLALTAVTVTDAATYEVTATNAVGSVTSNPATLTVNVPPTITTQPASQIVTAGANVTFTVVAAGTPAPTYQWIKDGTSISGATAASLVLSNVQSANAGSYTVVATNAAGSITSNAATLTVNAAPSVVLFAPTTGAVIPQSALLTLSASAAESAGIVAKVEFFDGATKLGAGTPASGQPGVWLFTLSSPLSIGAHTLTAVATDNLGSATTSAPVSIQINIAQPLSVNFSSLASGTTVPAPATFTLSVNATDPNGGTITKVEFYQGSTLLGTVTTPVTGSTTLFSFSPGTSFPIGTYTFTAKAYDSFGLTTTTDPVIVTVLATLPYTADFETSEGYVAGSLLGQLGWTVNQGAAQITSQAAFHGTQSLILQPSATPAQIEQSFAPLAGANIIFVDFLAKPVAEASAANATNFDVESTLFGFALNRTNGTLQAFKGDGASGGQWVPTTFATPVGGDNQTANWTRLTVRLDFTRKTWDLYANGVMVAADLGFRDNTRTYLSSFFVQGDTVTATLVDYLFAGPQNPLFADVNNDGIDDAWEVTYGLSLAADDRNFSPAGNGVTVLQAYLAGTNPNDYYNGQTPSLVVVSGDKQSAPPGAFNANPFVVLVQSPSGVPLVNAPVTFLVTQGGGQLSVTGAGADPLATALTQYTSANGTAQVYYQQPAAPNAASTIQISAGNAQVTLTTTTVQPALYGTDFEATEGYSVGLLAGQSGWTVSQGDAEITNQTPYSGAQSVVLQPGTAPAQITRTFAPAIQSDLVFVDFYTKPVAAADLNAATRFDVGSARFAFLLNQGQGTLETFDGDGLGGGQWTNAGFPVTLAANGQSQDWLRLTVRLDFVHQTWDLYVNSVLVAANRHFRDDTSNALSLFAMRGHAATAARLDHLAITADNPLFADVNQDGIDDAWETAQGLSLAVNDRDILFNGTGLTNLGKYLYESGPNWDSDKDGLPDAWELRYLGTLSYGASDDPGHVGRTLLQSYQQGLSPWPAATVTNGLRAWYRADLGVVKDANNRVSLWADLSGLGSHVLQSGNASQPSWASGATTGQPALQFSGNSSLQTTVPVDLGGGQSDITVIAILLPAASQSGPQPVVLDLGFAASTADSGFGLVQNYGITNSYQLAWRNGAQTAVCTTPAMSTLSNQFQILSGIKNGPIAMSYLNGVSQGTSAVDASMWTPQKPFTIGVDGVGANGYSGTVAEVLIYNRALSDSERQTVEQQLTSKYNGSAPAAPLPTVSLTSPANGSIYTMPASIAIAAVAAESDGSIAKVEFYQGATLVGVSATAPYQCIWNNATAGSYLLTAKATDASGATATSNAVPVIVNTPPSITLTAPANNAMFAAPANMLLIASAYDPDGSVQKVDFYNGASLLGTSTAAPYQFAWSNIAAGSYNLTAVATDQWGAATTSSPVSVVVQTPPIANPQWITGAPNTALTLTLTGSATGGGSLTYTVIDGPSNGALSGAAPNLTYTPTADFQGTDSFTFKVNDGLLDSAPATVTVVVNPVVADVTGAYHFVTLAGTATLELDGSGASAAFYQPYGAAVDTAGNIYVADSGNNAIRKVTPDGVVTTIAGLAGVPGAADGIGSTARFYSPYAVAVAPDGCLLVADTANCTIRKVTPTMISGVTTWTVTTVAGSPGVQGSTDGAGIQAQFGFPRGIVVDQSGNTFVADTMNETIRMITPDGVVTTIAGTPNVSGATDGTGAAARFFYPASVALDGAGNVYVADTLNGTIRNIAPTVSNGATTWMVTTIAGYAGRSGSADGVGNQAQFHSPQGIAVDGAGNIYVADSGNDTIREITPITNEGVTAWTVTTLAGDAGKLGTADGVGTQAQFNGAQGIAVDGAGNIYVADSGNSTIRRIVPTGGATTWTVTTLAGSVDSYYADGMAAKFNQPYRIAVDGQGNVFVADTGNSTIRKVAPDGRVTTIAGIGGVRGHADGIGAQATFNFPEGIAVDANGNIFVSDTYNNSIRQITPTVVAGATIWTVTTIAGSPEGSAGYQDGSGAEARFNNPQGIAIDASGNIFVADYSNSRIREIAPTVVDGVTIGAVTTVAPASPCSMPSDISVDSNGNIFCLELFSTIRCYEITPTTTNGIKTWAVTSIDVDGFYNPSGLVVDRSGNLFIADSWVNTVSKITPGVSDGTTTWTSTVIAGDMSASPNLGDGEIPISPGSSDGTGINACFNSPIGVAVDGNGNVYVADTGNNLIRKGYPERPPVATNGSATTPAGQSFAWTLPASDGGNPLTYTILNGQNGVATVSGNQLTFTPTTVGMGILTYNVSDGFTSSTGTLSLTITSGSAIAFLGNLSQSYDGTAKSVTVTTSPAGLATSVTYDGSTVAPSDVGTYAVVATVTDPSYAAAPATGMLTICPSPARYTAYDFTTIAGQPGTRSLGADGTGGGALFYNPSGVATASNGNIYVADQNDQTIREITPSGVVTTIAGTVGLAGSADGIGTNASFNSPMGVATDNGGNVYVADTYNDSIRKITPTTNAGVKIWTVSTIAGSVGYPGAADGVGVQAQFGNPRGIAVDGAGNIYVADTSNGTIREITPTTSNGVTAWTVTTIAGPGNYWSNADGTGPDVNFNSPMGIAVDASGNVFVTDSYHVAIRELTPSVAAGVTTWTVTTIAGNLNYQSGSSDGPGSEAQFNVPQGITVDANGNVYVADSGNDTIRKITPTVVAGVTSWTVTTIAGSPSWSGSADGVGALALLASPAGIAIGPNGHLYVGDFNNNLIREVAPTAADGGATWSVTTFAGSASPSYSDGTGTAAAFYSPQGAVTDGNGNVYIADTHNNVIREMTPNLVGGITSWTVTTLAGTPGLPGSSDGTGRQAQFNAPQGLAMDARGSIYVADTGNNAIRELTPTTSGGVTTWTTVTIAGGLGTAGDDDGDVSTATFNSPQAVAVDASGTIYIADTGNGTIREITPAGFVTTIAGSPNVSGALDGVGSQALFNAPSGLAVDGSGNVYVADTGNSMVRKLTPPSAGGSAVWMVSTIAGSPGWPGCADGLGGQARFNAPTGLGVDGNGGIYVADSQNNTIRKLTPTMGSGGQTWTVTTLGGVPGISGNADGAGINAQFSCPTAVAVNRSGNIYVTDSGNNMIRMGIPNGHILVVTGGVSNAQVNQPVTLTLPATDADGDVLTYTITGTANGTATVSGNQLMFTPTKAGAGTLTYVVSNGFTSSSTGTFTFTIADQSGTAIDVTNSFEYDDAGRLRSARTTTGLQHRYTYDEEGNLTAVEHTATATGNSAIPDWWENYYFGRVGIDPLGSAAHDGVSNLMKYALGASPLVPLSSPAGSISFASYTDGKTYPYITYVCAQEAASMLVVEQSSDAVTWQSGSACFEQVSAQDLGDGTERVVWRCLTPLPSASTLTFRLNANGQSTIAIPTGSVAMESMGPKGCDPGWPGRAVAVIKESNASIEPCNFNDATPIAASLQCLYASEGLGTRNCLARFAPPKLVLLGDSLQPSTRCRIPRLIGCSSPSFGRC